MQSLRYSFRSLVRAPGFTATVLTTLALCIGANLTIFAVVDAILLRPLPYPKADQLVTIFNTYPKAGVLNDGSSLTNYYERRAQIASFSSLSIYREGSAIVGGAGSTERETTLQISPEFFATLGIGPIIGRPFTDDEMGFQSDSVAILTDAYWRQQLNSDPHVLGRTIRVDGQSRKVIGVLPPDFRFLSSTARLYLPLASAPAMRTSSQRHSGGGAIKMIARLKPQSSLAEAQSQIDAHNTSMAVDDPSAQAMADAGFRSPVVSLHAAHVASVRPLLLMIQGGALILLLIGAVNIVNLLLIRASAGAKDLAVRQVLGASRRHVLGHVLREIAMLMTTGALLGLLVGMWGLELLHSIGADHLPLGSNIDFNQRLVLVTLLGATGLAIVIAGPIAWFNLHSRLAGVLSSESRSGTTTRSAQRLRHGFIIAQISLAFVLLAGAGLLGLSFKRVATISPGFQPDQILTGRITLPYQNYRDDVSRLTFTGRLLEAAGRQPGVQAVGIATNVPFSGNSGKSSVNVMGYVRPPGESPRASYAFSVDGDYFDALGFTPRQGRFLTAADSRRDSRVCVVDEAFAARYWPEGNAIGQRLFNGSSNQDEAKAFTVVGVVGVAKQADLTESEAQGTVYFPFGHRTDGSVFVVVRTSASPESLGPVLRDLVRSIDPELPVSDLHSMEVRISDSLLTRRSPALLAGIFAGVAMLLAAIGTYGVLAYAVSQRRREIGVRMALGALPRQVLTHFLQLGARLLFVGILLGALGAWAAGRAMQSLLFGIGSLHPGVLLATAASMIAIVFLAVLLPSRRAAQLNPLEALRSE
jgi:predicted permease